MTVAIVRFYLFANILFVLATVMLSVLLGYLVSCWFSEPANRALREWFGARLRMGTQAALRMGA